MSAFTWPKGLGDEPKPQVWEDAKPAAEKKDVKEPEQGTASRLKAEQK